MATTKSLKSLEKSKEAVLAIKEKLLPVLQKLTDDKFGEATGRAQASVALSIGMMRYMGARMRGLDEGRKADDPLRKDLNNIKRVLAKTKKASAGKKSEKTPSKSTDQPTKDPAKKSTKESGSELRKEKQSAIGSHKKKRKTKAVKNDTTDQLESPSKKSRKN